MLWFFFALGTAFFSALEAALTKRLLGHLSRDNMVACLLGWSWPIFAAYIIMMGWQPLGATFWLSLGVILPVNMAGTVIQYEAIRSAPLSLTMPFLAFTPAFMILTGFVVLGEVPSLPGCIGIAFVVAGSWVLNARLAGKGALLEPFRAMFRVRGSRLALVASIIWAFSAVLSKNMAQAGDPLYAGAMFFTIHNGVMVVGLLATRRASARDMLRHPLSGLAVGLTLAAHIACHFSAIVLVNAAYMVAVKRLNGVISVLFGGMLFRDSDLRSRLAGAAVMSTGAGIIVLFG